MDSECYQIENSNTYGGMAYSRKFYLSVFCCGEQRHQKYSPATLWGGFHNLPNSDKYVSQERQFLYAALP